MRIIEELTERRACRALSDKALDQAEDAERSRKPIDEVVFHNEWPQPG